MPSVYNLHAKHKLLRMLLRQSDASIPLASAMNSVGRQYREYVYANPAFILFSYLFLRDEVPDFVPKLLDGESLRIARAEIERCEVVQVEGPLIFDTVERNTQGNRPLILAEHNVEFEMHRSLGAGERELKALREKEKHAVDRADHIFVVSERDLDLLQTLYGAARSKVHVVPNGVDVERFRVPERTEKERAKRKLGFADLKVVLFAGSRHLPNMRAVEAIQETARKVENREILFVVAGSVGESVARKKFGNIFYTGLVDDILPYFEAADIAINPVICGGGTNLKVLEYMACGLPVITTDYGIRGFCFRPDREAIVSETIDFPAKIEKLLSDENLSAKLKNNARRAVEEHYSWRAISAIVSDIYEATG
jgi:glycosyltransferase involved in cell wall biosynthesis